jgi:hypothetical protein
MKAKQNKKTKKLACLRRVPDKDPINLLNEIPLLPKISGPLHT